MCVYMIDPGPCSKSVVVNSILMRTYSLVNAGRSTDFNSALNFHQQSEKEGTGESGRDMES